MQLKIDNLSAVMIIPEILCLTTMMCGVAPRLMCCLLTKNDKNLFTNNTFVFLDLQSRPRISRLVPTFNSYPHGY